jgi:hypothetical protein
MKYPKRMSFFLITSALALGVGLTLSINNKIDVNAAETLTYSTGFEASEGFSVSTVYNNLEPRLQGPSGQQWGTIMGTATTTAPLAGSQQIQLRSYVGNTTVGRAYPNFYFVNLTKVTFYTRAYISGSTMSVEYSLDNSTWAAMTITGTYSTTPSTIEASMPSGLSGNQPTVYFRINHTLVNVANRMYIDTVQVYAESSFGTLDHIAVDTMPAKTNYLVGETFSSSGLSLIGYDNANEEIANTMMIYEGFTTNYDSHAFTSGEVGTVGVTVTYSGKTASFNVSVAAVTVAENTLHLSSDDFVSTSYAANNGEHTKVSADTSSNIKYFTNQVMKNSSNPVIQWQSNTAYMYNTTSFVEIHAIVIDLGAEGVSALTVREGATIIPSSGSAVTPSVVGTVHTYIFSSGMPFFYISNGGATTYISTIEVITVDAYGDANTWAGGFLSSTGAVCVSNGSTNLTDLSNAWSALSTSYGNLSADAKNYFYSYGDTSIASAKDRYTYIVNKYSLSNFIVNYSGTHWLVLPSQNIVSDTSSNLHIIIAISIIGLSVLAFAFYLHQKKEVIIKE